MDIEEINRPQSCVNLAQYWLPAEKNADQFHVLVIAYFS